MQKADDDRKDEARGRAHEHDDEDEEDDLDESPHVHLPQRPYFCIASVRELGGVRDDKPDALPELVPSKVGPSAVQEEALQTTTPSDPQLLQWRMIMEST